MNANEVYYSSAPVFWATAVYSIILSIFHRFKRVISANSTDFSIMADLIDKYQVTQMMSAPTVMLNLLHHLNEKNSLHKFNSVQKILMAGSVTTAQLRKKIKKFTSAKIGIIYGMSEMCVSVAISKPIEDNLSSTIGKLGSNIKAKVNDKICF